MKERTGFEYENFFITKVAEGVYAAISYEGSKAMSNAGIVDLGDSTVIFDAFLSPTAAKELRDAAIQLTGRTPVYVINSHYHIDHTGGNMVFGQDSRIIAGDKTREAMSTKNAEMLGYYAENAAGILEHFKSQLEKSQNDEARKQLAEQLIYAETMTDKNYIALPPQLTFTDNLILHGSRNSMELMSFYNGHCECDTIAYIPSARVIFTGDIVFVGRHPWLGAGNPHNLQNILKGLGNYSIDTLIPGHGQVGAFEDIGLMEDYIRLVDSIAGEIRIGKLTLEEVHANSLPHPFDKWKGSKLIPNIRFLLDNFEG